MNIGELARLSKVPTETIRYYEKQKLLAEADRAPNNYRIYSQAHLEQLIFIKNCRAFDMTHEEIHQILEQIVTPNESCNTINEIIKEHLCHLEERIQELTLLKDELTEIEKRCRALHLAHNCSIVKDIASIKNIPARNTHLG